MSVSRHARLPEPGAEERFQGTCTVEAGEAHWKGQAVGHYDRYGGGLVHLELTLGGKSWDQHIQDLHNSVFTASMSGELRISGLTDSGERFLVPSMTLQSYQGPSRGPASMLSLSGVAILLYLGRLADEISPDQKLKLTATLSDSGVFHPTNTEVRPSIRFKSTRDQVDTVELALVRDEGGALALDFGTLSWALERPQAVAQCAGSGSPDVVGVLEAWTSDLEQALSLLGFICRTRVAWYEAHVTAEPGGNSAQAYWARVYRTPWRGYLPRGRDAVIYTATKPLIRPDALYRGLFDTLYRAYQTPPLQEIVSSALPHLQVSHEQSYLELRLLSAFMALERLARELAREQCAGPKIGNDSMPGEPGEQERFDAQVSGPDQRNFAQLILEQLAHSGFSIDEAWQGVRNAGAEFDSIIQGRHGLIHDGRLPDLAWVRDLPLVQALVERWILKLLRCPENAIDPLAF